MNIGPGPGQRPDTPSSVPESPGRGMKRGMKGQGGTATRRKKQQQPPPMSPMTPNAQMGPGPQMHPQMQVNT